MDSCFRNTPNLENNLKDFDSNKINEEITELNKMILNTIEELIEYISTNVLESNGWNQEYNIYSGNAGIAYMFWYLSQQILHFNQQKRTQFLELAKTLISRSLQWMSTQTDNGSDLSVDTSVIRGKAGIIFVACLVFDSLKDSHLLNHYLDCFVRMTGNSVYESN